MLKSQFHIILLIAVLGHIAGGCATAPGQRGTARAREAFLKDVCAQNNIAWQWDNVLQVATLKQGDISAKVLVGSDLVLMDNDRIVLSSPVRMVRSAVVVPGDFQSKVIDRFRRQDGVPKNYGMIGIRKIMVDPGHGGKDPGAIGVSGTQEKGVVLDIAKRLTKILKNRGYTVQMTRSKDEFISLQERTEMASRANVDLFVSVHANSSPARNVQGLEVYIAKDLGSADRNEEQRRTNQRLLFSNLSMQSGNAGVQTIVDDMLYSHKEQESKRLAEQFDRQTTRYAKMKSRGVKDSRFFVLRNTLIPAVLVEVGFLTNPKEEKMLGSDTYRQSIALGMAQSILDYAQGK